MASELSKWFVVVVVRVAGQPPCLVAGLYIPPATSRNVAEAYSTILGDLHEAVGRLSVRCGVPVERVLLVGDWNAHVGRLHCGEVDRAGPREGGAYHSLRYSECAGAARSAQATRGESFHRHCRRFGWLLLNGRCPSDLGGRATFATGTARTVIDLAVVPREATADLRVLEVPVGSGAGGVGPGDGGLGSGGGGLGGGTGGHGTWARDGALGSGGAGHRALWVDLGVLVPPAPSEPAACAAPCAAALADQPHERPVRVRLTTPEL